jgi:hypothetical protein
MVWMVLAFALVACAVAVVSFVRRRVRADELGSVSHQWRAEHSAK